MYTNCYDDDDKHFAKDRGNFVLAHRNGDVAEFAFCESRRECFDELQKQLIADEVDAATARFGDMCSNDSDSDNTRFCRMFRGKSCFDYGSVHLRQTNCSVKLSGSHVLKNMHCEAGRTLKNKETYAPRYVNSIYHCMRAMHHVGLVVPGGDATC